MDIEDIKRKCAALLAMAESTTNINEAAAFLAKVHSMMEKYQLEMHELHTSDPMGNNEGDVSPSDAWIFKVTSASARYWGARVIWEEHRRAQFNGKRKTYRIFGPESARTTHGMMIDFLIAQVKHQGRIYAKDHGVSASKGARNVGFAFAVRLRELAEDAKARRNNMVANALVPVDITKELIDKYYTKIVQAAGVRSGYSASAIGYANKISLAEHVTGASNVKMIK